MTMTQPHRQRIIGIIPAHNEAAHIAHIVTQVAEYLPVLVVDDGSTDDTAQLAECCGAQVIRQSPNQGKGVALITGFKAALELGCQAVLTLDADGQHDPLEIPKFLAEYERQSAGLIIGKRDYSQMPLRRRLPNTLGKALFSWAVEQDIPDNQSGYRLIRRDLLEAIITIPEQGFEFEVAMIAECLKRKLGLGWVPIRTIYADEKSHIRPLHHLQQFLRVSLAARRRMKS